MREVLAHPTTERAIKMLKRLAPRVYMMAMARRSDGKASTTSASRMIQKSVRPP